jgi:hypothetical protein
LLGLLVDRARAVDPSGYRTGIKHTGGNCRVDGDRNGDVTHIEVHQTVLTSLTTGHEIEFVVGEFL